MRACGGRVGGRGGDADYFAEAMKRKGFRFPPGQIRMWTWSSAKIWKPGDHSGDHNFRCFREGDEWYVARDPDDRAMLLFARDLEYAESGYWYT